MVRGMKRVEYTFVARLEDTRKGQQPSLPSLSYYLAVHLKVRVAGGGKVGATGVGYSQTERLAAEPCFVLVHFSPDAGRGLG